jgi:hypothetical protein
VSEEKQTFVIRRTFVLPLGLVVLLTLVLLGVCLIQGQPIAKVIILIGLLLPLAVLFIESALRRVDVSAEGVTAHRLFRQRCIRFADVTSLEAVRVRSRVFITLVAGEDSYLILSNSYRGFDRLLSRLVTALPAEAITPEIEQLLQKPPVRQADVLMAWFAVIALIYVLFAQFNGGS